ncbi:MAG: TonB-dependent receptor [Alphaproteobacteria bacterium]|nr:MAG: TonB-dependent receptor [Alphaproteobacteria bacterium]
MTVPAVAVQAQEQPAQRGILEEVVVVAQKREQSVQDVGIAITTYTGDQIRKLGVEQSFDIASFSPGVHISGNLAGQNTQFTIRGVTQNDFNDIVEAPNAVYLDEGYLAIAQAQTFAVFDIERVEILKGPQGTLFGRNATGGLVHYISRKPNFEEVDGYVDVTYGRFDSPAHADQIRVEAAIGGPLTDKVAARAAVSYNWHQGYLKNLYPDSAVGGSPGPGAGADLADDDTLAGRFTVAYDDNEEVRVTLSFNGARSNLATGPYQSKPTIGVFDANGELINVIDVEPGETRASIAADGSDFGSDLDNDGIFGLNDPDDAFLVQRFAPGGDFFGYRDPDGDDFTFSGDFAFKDHGDVDTWGVNGRIEWDLTDTMTLTSITDFKSYEKLLFIDVDSAPVNQSANYAGVDATSFTQELRVNGSTDRMRWVAGLFYLNIDSESDNGLKFPVGSVVPGAPFDLASDARLKTDSYSVFGQIEYDVSDTVTFILGGRLIQEEKDYEFTQSLYFTQSSFEIHQGTPVVIGPVFGPNGPEAFVDETSDTLWAGKAQLEFRPNDDLLLYAGVHRGVKAGSFNAQLAGGLPVPTSAIPYSEEVLYSYEGGFKASLGNFTRLNGSLFYYDYKDYQAFLFTGVSGVVINADAENYGVELELQTSPVEGLDAILAVSWFDATVKDVPLRVGGPIVRDVDPTYTPEFQFSGLVRYEWPAFNGRLAVSSDFSYSDSYFYNLRNFDADKFDSYFMVNARIGWTSEDDRWEVAAQVKNITDERAGIQGFDLATLCGCNEISFQPPRWFGLSVRHNL